MKELEACLQRADRKQAFLYLFCNFVSLMLITAYSGLMLSPVVQNIFPEGGDSRKQMYAIFVLALFGCTVFTVYAASLFFRKKSRQLGILMALGASRKTLAPGLFREVLFLSGASSLLGILTGFPFLLLLWNLFRFFIVDTEEMTLGLDFRCLWVSAAFMALVLFSACLLSYVYLRKTNLLDVIQEEHQNEPVKELAEDLVQETFVRALMNTETVEDLSRNKQRAWLYRTFKNLFFDRCRRAVFEKEYLQSLRPEQSRDWGTQEIENAMFLQSIRPEDRTLFQLRYFEGYTSEEISKMMNLPPGTVRSRLSRCRKYLKEILER